MKNRPIDYGYNLSLTGNIVGKENDKYIDPYERLVTAIYSRAAKDYARFIRMKLNGERLTSEEEEEFHKTIDFFYDNNFKDIIDVDGGYIMDMIIKIEREKQYEKKVKSDTRKQSA